MGKGESLRSGSLSDPFFTALRRLAHKGTACPARLRHRWACCSPSASGEWGAAFSFCCPFVCLSVSLFLSLFFFPPSSPGLPPISVIPAKTGIQRRSSRHDDAGAARSVQASSHPRGDARCIPHHPSIPDSPSRLPQRTAIPAVPFVSQCIRRRTGYKALQSGTFPYTSPIHRGLILRPAPST